MFQIDDKFLESLGLGALPQQEKDTMKRQIYETLEMRVGMTLASNMTDAQLDEFEALMNKNDEEGALRWLETNFPNYRDVVASELEKLKGEVKAAAPQILAEINQQQAPQAPAGYPAQPGTVPQPLQQQGPVQPSVDQNPYGAGTPAGPSVPPTPQPQAPDVAPYQGGPGSVPQA